MPIQTSGTGNLDEAQGIMIAECRYTAEHAAPNRECISNFKLAKGNKSMTYPLVGQMTAQALTEGVDLINAEAIGMSTIDLTTEEVGLKVILTKKLLRQASEDMLRVVGRQMGDAMARYVDREIIGLYAALNSASDLGATGKKAILENVVGCIAWAKSNKLPGKISMVLTPNQAAQLSKSAMAIGVSGASFTGIHGYSEELLSNFFGFGINSVPVFHDGNIDYESNGTDAKGAIYSEESMCLIESLALTSEREEDISLRAWEIVVTSDFGVFSLNTNYGAPILWDSQALDTDIST